MSRGVPHTELWDPESCLIPQVAPVQCGMDDNDIRHLANVRIPDSEVSQDPRGGRVMTL